MFDLDSDGKWDVTQEAESLTKSLFGAPKKKKSKHHASKKDIGVTTSTFLDTLDDSDNETFTKKGIRKMKEKRRKKKKQDKNLGESHNAEILSFSSEKKHEGRLDSDPHLNTYSALLKKSSKHMKSSKVGNESEKNPGLNSSKVEKSNKRKRASIPETAELSAIPQKKRKINKKDTALTNASVPSIDEAKSTKKSKKRKRKKKKKNNSKKNKYAHLALNRKGKETLESAEDHNENKQTSADKVEKNKTGAKRSENLVTSSKELSEKEKSVENDTYNKIHPAKKSLQKAMVSKSKTGGFPAGDVKRYKTSGITAGNETKPMVTCTSEKKRKRGKDLLMANLDETIKAENTPEKQNVSLTPTGAKLTDKPKKKVKVYDENNHIENAGEKSKVSNGDNRKKQHSIKTSESAVQKKMLDLLKKQKKLLKVLKSELKNTTTSEPSSAHKTSEKKHKKKSKSKKKSEDLETSATDSKPSSQNQKGESKNLFLAKSDLAKNASKISSQPQRTQNVNDYTSRNSSLWGDKATAINSQAQEKLNAARFRYLNEQLYTCQGNEALQMFKEDRDAFKVYHTGFENQACKWPVNPVNIIIKQIKDKSPSLVVADFGCGDAKLAQALPHKVHSFDLVALNSWVKACDMSNVPLQNESVDIAVFCLSLMGTNLNDYIHEANRVLKTGGLLKIVEVVSRFQGLSSFLAAVCSHGFQLLNKRDLSQMFYLMDFKKVKLVKKAALIKSLSLKPCVYKKR